MTNRAALFAQSIQCSSSTVMVMISSMKPSMDDSLAVIYTDKGSAVAICLLTAVSPPVGVRIGVASLDHMCPRIHPGVDRFLGQFPL